jgi:hypothetical protein
MKVDHIIHSITNAEVNAITCAYLVVGRSIEYIC